jgi:FkbM family methyltransferase
MLEHKGPVCRSKRITSYQKASSHARGLLNSTKIISKYRKAYRNYFSVLKHIIRKEYPAEAVLRNGQKIELSNFELSYNIARLYDQQKVAYDLENDTVLITDPLCINSKPVTIKGGLRNGEIFNIFVEKVYQSFPVEGKTVIDIGANIADSCIYFFLRGAKRIIGVEPLLENYKLAEQNIRQNSFSDKISVLLAGCSARSGHVSTGIDELTGKGWQITSGSTQGRTIPLLTLEEIIQQSNLRQGEIALKMDCEGCEYDIVLFSTKNALRRFSNILIEYHYGYRDIKDKLENSGFDISLVNISGQPGGPTAIPNPSKLGNWYHMGYIHARRN